MRKYFMDHGSAWQKSLLPVRKFMVFLVHDVGWMTSHETVPV